MWKEDRPMNRTRSHVLFGVAASAVLVSACGQSPVEPDPHSWIFGRWVWVQSVGGFAGDTRTPDTAGFSLELEFQTDGDLLIYRNGSLETRSWFELEESEAGALLKNGAPILGTDEQIIVLIDEHRGKPEPWDQDSMALVEICDDCFTHEFARVP
jgi:hypothetical protein